MSMSPPPPVEPRRMSLADLLVGVAGCAVGFSVEPLFLGWRQGIDAYGIGSFEYNSLWWTARGPLLILALATALAILVRRARYGGMPRPTEWPALVMAADLASDAVLDRAYAALALVDPPRLPVWRPDRWPWAGAWSFAALAGLVLLLRFERRLPSWARTLGLVVLAVMLLCGPVHVYFKQATGAPPQPVGSPATWAFQLQWAAWGDGGRWPNLLLFGLAIATSLRDWKRRGRRGRIWTEWASVGMGLALVVCWWLDRISLVDPTNPARLASVVVRGVWLLGIGLVSWLVIRGCVAARTWWTIRAIP
jgi:hypothetical protein